MPLIFYDRSGIPWPPAPHRARARARPTPPAPAAVELENIFHFQSKYLFSSYFEIFDESTRAALRCGSTTLRAALRCTVYAAVRACVQSCAQRALARVQHAMQSSTGSGVVTVCFVDKLLTELSTLTHPFHTYTIVVPSLLLARRAFVVFSSLFITSKFPTFICCEFLLLVLNTATSVAGSSRRSSSHSRFCIC
jgi:hypothetical protein